VLAFRPATIMRAGWTQLERQQGKRADGLSSQADQTPSLKPPVLICRASMGACTVHTPHALLFHLRPSTLGAPATCSRHRHHNLSRFPAPKAPRSNVPRKLQPTTRLEHQTPAHSTVPRHSTPAGAAIRAAQQLPVSSKRRNSRLSSSSTAPSPATSRVSGTSGTRPPCRPE
jgi:hypothetical protein